MAYQEKEGDKPISPLGMAISISLAIVLAIALFKFLPLLLTAIIGDFVRSVSNSSVLFNLIDGLFRIGIFLLYIFAIGFWKEMSRIFQYHGAEHKVIYAYEAGEELTVENARKHMSCHPRCGTSFLLIVMVISIMVFIMIPKEWTFVDKLLSRIALIPVIAGLSYEVLRLSAKMKDNPLMNF